jgi:hypothetical protein
LEQWKEQLDYFVPYVENGMDVVEKLKNEL